MPFHSKQHHKEVDRRTHHQAQQLLGVEESIKYGIPKRPTEDGGEKTWEPEFGPTLRTMKGLFGAQQKLMTIPRFKIFPKITRDFSYVSATISAPTGYVGRARWNYFNEPRQQRGNLTQHFTERVMTGGKTGFKSDKKSAYREECEAPLNEELDLCDSMKQMRVLHETTLPPAIYRMSIKDIHMKGLMCVERAGFEGTHLLKDGNAKFLINYAGSYDVGTCHDIRLQGLPSIIAKHFEVELEATNVHAPYEMDDHELIEVIEASMEEIEPQVSNLFKEDTIPEDDPRYTMGKNTRAAYEQSQHATAAQIRALGKQPADLMTKAGKASLHEIFDADQSPLIPPEQIHFLAQMDSAQTLLAMNAGLS